jgi:hypothetical protein
MLCVIEGGVGENNEKFIIDLNLFEESWIEIGGNKVLQMEVDLIYIQCFAYVLP